MFRWYSDGVLRRPVLAKSVSAGAIVATGDAIQQLIEMYQRRFDKVTIAIRRPRPTFISAAQRKGENAEDTSFDLARSLRMGESSNRVRYPV
jgi:hypothetical protein